MRIDCRLSLLAALLGLGTGGLRAASAADPPVVLLWPDGAPGAAGADDADRPSLTVYRPAPERASGLGVVVCPGGAYVMLAADHEGRQVAEWLNSEGHAAFLLRYRLGPRYRHPAPLRDAQRALRWVRLHAGEMGVRPDAVGIWGFSAGGHLAATAGTHFDAGDPKAADPIERQPSRPDFLVLAYPVISFTADYTHTGSRTALLGASPDPALLEDLSLEKRVTKSTPPTFLFHTDEDRGVPPENSVSFYLALRKAGVPAELHIYERGQHGVGLAPKDEVLHTWTARLADWLRARLKQSQAKA